MEKWIWLWLELAQADQSLESHEKFTSDVPIARLFILLSVHPQWGKVTGDG
jgi:hypothetical protein